MIIRLLEVSIKLENVYNTEFHKQKVAKLLKTKIDNIKNVKIQKRSVDARKKDNVHYKFIFDVELFSSVNLSKIDAKHMVVEKRPKEKQVSINTNKNVCVVGSGPSGLFCALKLALSGVKVTLLERGEKIEDRVKTVENFLNGGKFNEKSNIQFGEGGAGTFSDGKLNTGIKSEHIDFVLQTFYDCGAEESILYDSKPHIGTDVLRKVIVNLRNKLLELGVEIKFKTLFTGYEHENGLIKVCFEEEGRKKEQSFDRLVLAIGYSARDTLRMLDSKKMEIIQKDFAVGYRIEHLKTDIDKSQYGGFAGSKYLEAADYKLFEHLDNGRTVYTFCMCPGGRVVPAMSKDNEICTNGMSFQARNEQNSNSAILVNVRCEDYESNSPLAGVEYQEKLEKNAFIKGKGKFICSRVEDFLKGQPTTKLGKVVPSIKPAYVLGDVSSLLDKKLVESLKEGIVKLGKKLKGFDQPDAILTGVETRSSAPYCIVRKQGLQTSEENIYAIGEGAGQAGGIMSSAVDGIKIALEIIKNYSEK